MECTCYKDFKYRRVIRKEKRRQRIMNPVFWFLVFLAAVVLWLAISFIFIPLGGLLLKLVKRILNIINYEENDSESEEKENEEN
jgi:predicted nucleic acid-binding Zn ribbon protein